MNDAWVSAAALALLVMGSACDPAMDGSENDEEMAEDIWIRELVVGNFELSLVSVFTARDGSCTTTVTHTADGNGDLAVGSLTVGIPDANGDLVLGAIGLNGHVTASEENSPANCWGSNSSWEMDGTAGGTLSLKAPRAGDMMTLALAAPTAGTIEEVKLETTVFAADALYDDGAAQTLRLQETVHVDDDGESGRDVEVRVDAVVDIVAQE